MKYAYSAAAVRAAEHRSGIPEAELSAQAGAALAAVVRERAEQNGVHEALFVCGGGNNGADGFFAANLLLGELDVEVLCLAEKFSPVCSAARAAFGGEILGRIPRRRYALIVDCLFGTGLSRPIEKENAALVDFINGNGAYVVACDVPSGLSEGGVVRGKCVRADVTVTFGALKQSLLLSDGADNAGEIVEAAPLPAEGGAEIWAAEDVRALFPKKRSHTNKGSYGRVTVLAGYGSLGAPLLAVGAALKSGAGYTELLLPPSESAGTDEMHRTVFSAKYPACIVGLYGGQLLSNAVAYGMGAGVGNPQRETLETLLSEYRYGTLVLDADALNTLAAYRAADLLRKKECPVVITPHIKEFSRLTGKSAEEVLADPVGCAAAFAAEYGVTVVLKNNRTVITDGHRAAINTTGSPALAKGGSGDALAGFLAGTCARGVPPFEAAVAACYLCGRAGELAAAEMGEYAPSAEDILRYLPLAFR